MSESQTRLPATPGPEATHDARRLYDDGSTVRELMGKPDGVGLFDLAKTQDGGCSCILCGVCQRHCPVSCIDVRRYRGVPKDEVCGLHSGSFKLDETRCIACGHCVESCALSALVPTPAYGRRRAAVQTLAAKEEGLAAGHSLCPGCGASVIVNQVLAAVDGPYVATAATGCLEVSTTRYPRTAWRGSFIHTNFENAAATLSGVETAFRALKKKGLMEEHIQFIAFGGDGGTYDIGLQSLSGAMERGHNMLYVCYDNGAYMNTGFQRSSATPMGAWTTTSPVGSQLTGKAEHRKNLTEIMVAHRIPYVAQASPHDPADLMRKAAKALAVDGPTFLNVLSPCPRGWRSEDAESIELAREAADTCYWPLFEVENGRYRLTYRPRKKLPVAKWLERQGRFSHLSKPGEQELLDSIQRWVDDEWDLLLRKCGEPPESDWVTRKTRVAEDFVVHQVPLHTHSLGEPLTASMTSTALEWEKWPALTSAMCWGAIEE